MNFGKFLLVAVSLLAILLVAVDILYTSQFVKRFKALERERIVTSNQLATAKIVSENLEHVRELVFHNIVFAGQLDTVSQESILFDFLTKSANDLKMRLVSVRPLPPTNEGRVTTYGYDIQLEGDFFSLGEFCAKLESSQRVFALTTLDVAQQAASPDRRSIGVQSQSGRRNVIIRMHLDMFKLRKG